ncbi:MAG: uncharacterized protein KVP18_001106 [Porospora cf. gigantea A]|nr:MAG: hypothetical protein KVP18_001106 [Porospora cf. gigantea A]
MVRLPINLITGYFTLSSMNSKADSTAIATQLFNLLHGFHIDLSEARKRREADLSQETVLEPAPATTTKDMAVLERVASKKEEILDDKVEEEKKKLEPPPPVEKPKPPEFAIVPTPLEMAALEGLEKALRDDIPPDTPQKVITSIDLEHDNQLMAEMRARCDVVETEPVEVQLHREVAAEFTLNLDELEVASESSGPTLIVESSPNSSADSSTSEESQSSASTTSLASGTPGVVFPVFPSEGQSSISATEGQSSIAATDDAEVAVEDPNFRDDRQLSTAPPWESPMQADVMHPFRRRRQRSMGTKRGKGHGAFHPGLEHVKASKNVAVTTAALDTAVQALAEAEHQAVRQKDPKSQQTIPREFFEKFLTGQELTAFFRQADPGKTNLINENSMQRVLVNMHNTKKSLVRAMDAQLQIQVVFGNLINIILITVTFFVFLVCIGLSPESIIVSGAAVVSSVIVSMSFLYTSFVQSVMLICFVNPFTVGDRLRLGPSQQIHVVRKITTFYTEFVNIEEKIVIYSNASLITEKIVNDSRSRAACFVVHMLVSDLTPAPRIKALRQLVEAYVLARPSEYIHKDYAMIIEAVQPGHYFDLTFYVTYMTSWHKWQAVCAARSAVIQYILKICNVLHIEYKLAVQRWETISAEGEKV